MLSAIRSPDFLVQGITNDTENHRERKQGYTTVASWNPVMQSILKKVKKNMAQIKMQLILFD